MKRWQIGLNIISEILFFLIGAALLIFIVPRLLGGQLDSCDAGDAAV